MKSLIKHLILSFLLLFSTLLTAQSISYRNLTTKDGLPSNTIYQIKQDKKGFIWIATANGLVRYDGKNLKTFNPEEIKDKEILGIFIDKQDKVWFWNLKGRLFYIQDEIIKCPDFAKENLNIIDFHQNNKGYYYYISRGKGLFKVNKEGISKFISYKKRYFNLFNFNDTIAYTNGAKLWKVYDETPLEYIEFFENNFTFQEQVETYRFITKLLNNKIWSLHQLTDRLFKVDRKGVLTGMGFPNHSRKIGKGLLNIFTDTNKRYWLITENEVLVFDSTETNLEHEFSLPYNNSINNFLEDNEGNYWLSTDKNGLFIIPNIDFRRDELQTEAIESNFVSSLAIKNNTIYYGLLNGQLLIKTLENNQENLINLELKNSINKIIFGQEKIWILTPVRLFTLNSNKLSLDKYYANQVNINYKTLYEFEEYIYIGNFSGVMKIKKADIQDALRRFNWTILQEKYGIQGINKRTYAIEKVDEEFWFGTTDGLYHYQRDSATLTTIPELKNTWITNIINKNDTIWIGTQTDGLFQIINKKVTKVFNENNGLISNNCKTLAIENGVVWIGTNNGINRINLITNEIELINSLDGLSDNNINALVIDQQKVYAGTSEGLVSFDKNIKTKNTTPPPIYLAQFQIFERDTVLSENYNLKYDQNNIRIGFTGISFRSQGNIQYKYRLKGLSDSWSKTTSDYVSYPVLNPDNYTFEAYAINEDGVESEVPVRINIKIQKPFWTTWWFRFLTIGIIALIIWFIFKSRIKRINAQNKFQNRLDELEMQALQAQMNPHFIFNALNAIQHYLTIGEKEKSVIYLAKFAKLIRTIFEYSKKTTISLTQEIEFLKLYTSLEKLRFKDKINVIFEVDKAIYTDDVSLPPLLIQPLIENAFKHGLLHKKDAGNLQILIYLEQKTIKCCIIDDGIGREKTKNLKSWKSKIHESSGLKTTEERLKMWHKNSKSDVNNDENQPLFKIVDLKKGKQAIGTKIELNLGTYIPE